VRAAGGAGQPTATLAASSGTARRRHGFLATVQKALIGFAKRRSVTPTGSKNSAPWKGLTDAIRAIMDCG
jgi:hypothetical protein